MKRLLLAAVAVAVLAGCASSPNRKFGEMNMDEQVSTLVSGQEMACKGLLMGLMPDSIETWDWEDEKKSIKLGFISSKTYKGEDKPRSYYFSNTAKQGQCSTNADNTVVYGDFSVCFIVKENKREYCASVKEITVETADKLRSWDKSYLPILPGFSTWYWNSRLLVDRPKDLFYVPMPVPAPEQRGEFLFQKVQIIYPHDPILVYEHLSTERIVGHIKKGGK